MFLFYVDESGNRDTTHLEIRNPNGAVTPSWLYVLTAVSLFERDWHGFEKTINRRKTDLIRRIGGETPLRLELADCEIKSNWIRNSKERAERAFLANLTVDELNDLIGLYYAQLEFHKMHVLSVLIDKRFLKPYLDQEKIHRKAWELLLEQVEFLMRVRNDKHQAILITDETTRQSHRSLAMKHAFIMDQGTKENVWLKHICEMPLFVNSELSNGVQLADLCSYNIYRAFSYNDLDYPFFSQIVPRIWSAANPVKYPFSGIRVFPPESPLHAIVEEFENARASSEK